MKFGSKIIFGLGAGALLGLLANRGRHRTAIRGATLLMMGAARHLDWKMARESIERGARVVVYARSAGEVDRALRELRRLGPSSAVEVSSSADANGLHYKSSAPSMGAVLGVVGALGSFAKWLWPAARSPAVAGEAPSEDPDDWSSETPAMSQGRANL